MSHPPGSSGERPPGPVPRGTGAAILRALALGEKSVGELVRATGVSQPNVSNHLARLRERGLVESHRQGRQVYYRIATAGLAQFVLSHREDAPPPAEAVEEIRRRFLEAVLTFKEEEVVYVVDEALAGGLSWRDLYLRVFVPALARVGELWERGELTVAGEHLITGITLRLVHRLSMNLPVSPAPGAPSVLVGCVEGELHTVGGRMVADFLMAQGWRVWYLNGYLPLEHLMDGVQRHLPDVVALCISTDELEGSLGRAVERLRRWRGEQPLPLIVAGGRYFQDRRAFRGPDISGVDVEAVTREMAERVAQIRGG